MNILRNTSFVTPLTRTVISVLVLAIAFTSTDVQSAHASDFLPEAASAVTKVVSVNDKGIVVPKETPAQAPAAATKPAKKRWNTINAPDLETKAATSDEAAVRTITVPVSAYTSEVAQCDSTPFTTANGTQVRDGIVAANFLKFGTRFRIPEYFGNKVFEVHDRMNARYTYRIDIWMVQKAEARTWGVRNVKVEILP